MKLGSKTLIAVILGVFVSRTPVAAQVPAEAPPSEPYGAPGPYMIRTVDFEVDGITMELALREKVDISGNETFPDLTALEAFVADRRQLLSNERVLESVAARYALEPAPGGGFYADLIFSTKDSWNIIALPKPKYDSNTGFDLSVRARDYNFLGSMRTLAVNFDYSIDEVGAVSYGTRRILRPALHVPRSRLRRIRLLGFRGFRR